MVSKVKEWEKMEYSLFKFWWDEYPNLRHPDTAITSSAARWIANLVYEKLKKEKVI